MLQNNNRDNGEARCFLCTKDKLNGYHFFEEDYLSLIFKKQTLNNKNLLKPKETNNPNLKSTLNQAKIDVNKLFKPCKCGTYVHYPCLMQYCLLHLSFKCAECQRFYNIKFDKILTQDLSIRSKKHRRCFYFELVFIILFHLILLAAAILFILFKWIPKQYEIWNYFLAIIIIVMDIVLAIWNFTLYIRKYKLINKIIPIFSEYLEGHKQDDDSYENMKIYTEQILKCYIEELIELKVNGTYYINSSILTKKKINEYIISNNNDILTNNNHKIINESDDLENRFHGHQIIRSLFNFVNNNENQENNKDLCKSKTKNMFIKGNNDIPLPRRSLNLNMKNTEKKNKKAKEDNDNINVYNSNLINDSKGNLISVPSVLELNKNETKRVSKNEPIGNSANLVNINSNLKTDLKMDNNENLNANVEVGGGSGDKEVLVLKDNNNNNEKIKGVNKEEDEVIKVPK